MLSAGDTRGGGPVRNAPDTERRVQEYMRLVEEGAPADEIQRAEAEIARSMNIRPFELRERVPFFMKVAQALAGANAYQNFHLPGRERVVSDMREKTEQGRPEKAEPTKRPEASEHKKAEDSKSKQDKQIRDNKEASRAEKKTVGGVLDRATAEGRVEKLYSSIENLIIKRFEQGLQIEKNTKPGEAIFAQKTDAQWKDFFKILQSRTMKKNASFNDIREFLFRGLISKGNKGMFIGDMRLANGRVDKFIRFLILGEIISYLKGLKPGQTVQKGDMGMSGEDLMYLALAASRGSEMDFSEKASEGKFMGGRAEQLAADELGLTLDTHLKEKAKRLRGRKGKGFMGSLFEKDAEPEDLPYSFVPWWHWGNLTRPSARSKWFTIAFYGSLLALAIMGVAVMTLKILKG